LGDVPQGRFIEPAAHHFTFGVTYQLDLAPLVGDADFRAGFRADADGENHHAIFRERLGHLHSALFEIFTVGDQHDDFFAI